MYEYVPPPPPNYRSSAAPLKMRFQTGLPLKPRLGITGFSASYNSNDNSIDEVSSLQVVNTETCEHRTDNNKILFIYSALFTY